MNTYLTIYLISIFFSVWSVLSQSKEMEEEMPFMVSKGWIFWGIIFSVIPLLNTWEAVSFLIRNLTNYDRS